MQRQESRDQLNLLNVLTAVCLLVAGALALMMISVTVRFNSGHFWKRDMVEYWASGKLLVEGGNPYDIVQVFKLESFAGSEFAVVPMNPPIILPFLAPLGHLSAHGANLLWLILMLLSLGASIGVLWNLGGRRSWAEQLLCLCFVPIIACVMMGQIGIFLLLSVTIFLALHRSWPFVAGLALVACATKPHLFVPFGLVLLIWIVSRKRHSLFAGFATGILCTVGVAYFLDPHAWSQWREFMQTSNPSSVSVQNLSRIFRNILNKDASWLQFVPVCGASAWAVWYFVSRRERWNWLDQGLLLLIVSVGCAPYSWLTDESVLFPAVVAGVWRARKAGRPLLPLALILCVSLFQLTRGWYFKPSFVWTVLAWLAWYLYATQQEKPALQPEAALLSQ